MRRLLPDEEFSEAAGVLEMISKTPEELMLYNARLKFQRDEFARLEQSRLEVEHAHLAAQQARLAAQQAHLEAQQARLEAQQAHLEAQQAHLDGEARGISLGRIRVFEELLGLQPSTPAELAGYDDTQLLQLAEQLQHQLRTRSEP